VNGNGSAMVSALANSLPWFQLRQEQCMAAILLLHGHHTGVCSFSGGDSGV